MLTKETLGHSRPLVLNLILALVALGLVPSAVVSQGTIGRIVINVLDAEGKPASGVAVSASCEALPRFSRKTKTNKRGKATISVVDATEVYQITVTPEEGQPLTINVKPQLGAQGTERTVQLGGRLVEAAVTEEGGGAPESSFTPAQTAFNEGVDALKANDLGAAEAKFKEAIELEPNLGAAYSAIAGVYVTKKDWQAALAATDRLEALEGESARLFRLRYEAHQGLGNDSEASKALKALDRLGEGGDATALTFNRGADAMRVGDLRAAREAFEEALEMNADLVPALSALTTIHLVEGRWSDAVAVAERTLAIEPENPKALKARYEALRQEGSPEAKAAFEALAAVDPKAVADEEFERGVELFDGGSAQDAIEAFERVLTILPDHALAHYRLGLSYISVDEAARARGHLERFIALAPENPEVSSAKEMLQFLE